MAVCMEDLAFCTNAEMILLVCTGASKRVLHETSVQTEDMVFKFTPYYEGALLHVHFARDLSVEQKYNRKLRIEDKLYEKLDELEIHDLVRPLCMDLHRQGCVVFGLKFLCTIYPGVYSRLLAVIFDMVINTSSSGENIGNNTPPSGQIPREEPRSNNTPPADPCNNRSRICSQLRIPQNVVSQF